MSTHLLGSLEDGEHVQAKQHASTPAREHCAMQGPEDLLRHLRGPSLCFVRPARTSQSGFVGNVVIRSSDEMPGSGRLAERLNRETKSVLTQRQQAIGWLDGGGSEALRERPAGPGYPRFQSGSCPCAIWLHHRVMH